MNSTRSAREAWRSTTNWPCCATSSRRSCPASRPRAQPVIDEARFSDCDEAGLAQARTASIAAASDFSDYSKVVVRKPWGYEYLIFQNDSVAVWILYLEAAAETSTHCHPTKK